MPETRKRLRPAPVPTDAPGPSRPPASLKLLASELGLSQSTVSRALRAHPAIPEATRRRVERAAEAAGYRPDARARGLAIGRAETIGLVFHVERVRLPEANFVEVLAGIAAVVTARNYSLMLSPFEQDESALLRKLASSRTVDGVILTRPLVDDPRIRLMNELGLPYVVHGRSDVAEPYSWIDTDSENVFERLTRLLLDYGHRNIVAINGVARFRYAPARARSFRAAFAAYGVACPEDAVEFTDMTERAGYETALRRLARADRPTAFVCGSAFQARGVYRALAEAGLRVGRDVSVVAHDDGVRGCNPVDLVPPLTTALTSSRDAGELLAASLIDLIEGKVAGPVRHPLPFDVILRDSVGPAPDRGS